MAKIVHLTSVHPPFDTRIFHKECKTLAQSGYAVTLVVPHERDQVVDGVWIRAIPRPARRLNRMIYTTWQVYRAALKVDADIYHVHDPELLPWAQLLRLRGKKVIYDMHENVPGALLTKAWIAAPLRRLVAGLYQAMEHVLLQGLGVILAETSYARHYPRIAQREVVLNLPLADNLLQINEMKYPATTLGYIGGVAPVRGSLVTLEALRLLKKQQYAVEWECLGPIYHAAHAVELRQLIEKYALTGVRLRGYTPPEEGWRLIARCHIGLALLQEIPNYIESYPTKIFEYMALGLPVVVSNFPLYREIVGGEQCGLCVDPADPEAVAQALVWLIEHPEQACTMGERGRQAVKDRYNWDSQARKLLVFYDTLLKCSE